jgi:hypothetical protein
MQPQKHYYIPLIFMYMQPQKHYYIPLIFMYMQPQKHYYIPLLTKSMQKQKHFSSIITNLYKVLNTTHTSCTPVRNFFPGSKSLETIELPGPNQACIRSVPTKQETKIQSFNTSLCSGKERICKEDSLTQGH